MNAALRRRLEMAARVRDFLRAHKVDGVGEGLGLAKLEELLTRGEVLAAQQRAGVVGERSATKRREKVRRALQSKLLLYLRAVGAVAAKENAELAMQFRMPPANASQQALLTAGRGMLEKATAHKDLLVSRGMSALATTSFVGCRHLDVSIRRLCLTVLSVRAWASARNVLGPFRSKESDGGGEAPGGAGPGVVKPAA